MTASHRQQPSAPPPAVEVELFSGRFVAIVREMGERLRRTALSTNVRERLDFSCGLFDTDGFLVVNAPHIPVHLGALGLCVRQVSAALPLGPGDVAVTNHPAFGGSHLPDVTVVRPVFEAGGSRSKERRLLGYVANRAHHAEIGGTRPGSMPPDARCLAEEGVVIAPRLLVRAGEADWSGLRRCLFEARYPSRAVEENLADLQAAVAANQYGAEALRGLASRFGAERVREFMAALAERAARRMEAALREIGDGEWTALERLDDDTPLAVSIRVRDGRARIDFSGSGPVHPGNLNATPAIVRSVVLYVLRLLVKESLPLNEGLMRPLEMVLPRGLLNPPFSGDAEVDPAVVGGNVETSQRLVDTLLKALGLVACSQGTMNNLLFGNRRVSYYETICGGCGAGPGFSGADAVHSHMTNTAITDPEILELRYPVRLERFSIRRGSGGAGRYQGGDGVVRELTFLEPVSLSLLTQHRRQAPYGVAGGSEGATGRQRLVRVDGSVRELEGVDACELQAGDRLILETPGGGGWGPPEGGDRP